jgi:hypothetical protein
MGWQQKQFPASEIRREAFCRAGESRKLIGFGGLKRAVFFHKLKIAF